MIKNVISNKFEATMIACQKSKIKTERKSNPADNKRKKVVESKRLNKRSDKKFEEFDPELEEEEADGVLDDIIVVTDPELDPEDMDDKVSDLQEIIDNTPEGEVPTINDYVDDKVYTCPACGSNFFSDEDMNDGDECPVCGEIPEKFILVGDVAQAESSEDEEGNEIEDVEDDEIEDMEDEEIHESLNPKNTTLPRRPKRKTESTLYVDEKTFNPLLNKFVRENYKNAKSMRVNKAKLSNSTLSLECKITYGSGNTKNTVIKIENFSVKPKCTLNAKLDKAFKVESSNNSHAIISAICIKGSKNENILRATGLRYNFTSVHENKRYKVYGSCKING